ncbi:hypothetical protein V9T40_011989 [Parthenolecanium corni]|uniref:RNA-directed DNA polymerase n=1 Tax=Parthenolecanium corni TaxID=536013 RepID=A0AAN9Y027_9HEMI
MLPRSAKRGVNYSEKRKNDDPESSNSQPLQRQVSFSQPVQTQIPIKGAIPKESNSQPPLPPERTSPPTKTQIKTPAKVSSPVKKISVINESNSTEKIRIAKNDKFVPSWKDFKIFGDASIFSWLEKSVFSDVSSLGPEKVSSFLEPTTVTEFINFVTPLIKKDDSVIVGFGEELVLHADFDIDMFAVEIRKFVNDLFLKNYVKVVIFCTIPPDKERMTNSHYRSALRNINRKIWNMKSEFKSLYILDFHSFFSKRYEAELTLEGKDPVKKQNEPKERRVIAPIRKHFTREEVRAIDNHLTVLIREYIEKEEEDENEADVSSAAVHLITADEDSEEEVQKYPESCFSIVGDEIDSDPEGATEYVDQRLFFPGMYFPCYIGEKESQYPVFIDPGSPYSYVREDFVRRLQFENPDLQLLKLKKPFQDVGYAEGRPKIKVGGTICLDFKMKDIRGHYYKFTAYIRICKDLNTRLLLGRQCLWDYDAILRVKQRTLDVEHPDSPNRLEIPGVQFNTMESVLAVEPPVIPKADKIRICNIAMKAEISDDEKLTFQEMLLFNHKVFEDRIGRCNTYTHTLQMKHPVPEMNPKDRPIAQARLPFVQSILDLWLRDNIVTPRGSIYITPIHIILKENGSLRLCMDSREINNYMGNSGDIVPPIDQIKTMFLNATVFSKLDFRDGFLQIPLAEESQKYIAFRFKGQPYVFNRLAYGLKDSMPGFIAALRTVLQGLDHCCTVYVDDLLIFSDNIENHLYHLNLVIHKIQSAGMTLNVEKCKFFQQSVKYLGFIVSDQGISPDPKRVEAIYEYRTPKTKKEVQSFLGVINYYRGHIPKCGELAAPLHELTKSNVQFHWGPDEETSFNELKKAVAESILQNFPDWSRKFYVITDASNVAISGIVVQFDDENQPKVLGMVSRLLKTAEKNYDTYEKELLAIIYTIKKHIYLLVDHPIILRTDNRALKYLNSAFENVSERVARWRAYLQPFDIELIEHVPGSENKAADALSRFRRDISQNVDHFAPIPAVMALTAPGGQLRIENILDNLADLQNRDPEIQEMIKKRSSRISFNNRIVYLKNRDGECRMYALKSIRNLLIEAYHQEYTHPGYKKVLDVIRRYFDWPGCKFDVVNYSISCAECKTAKYPNETLHGPFQSVISTKPLELLSIDTYGPLPTARGGARKIVVIMDVFSKYTRLYPTKKTSSLQCIKFTEQFLKLYDHLGTCLAVLTDNGSQFRSSVWTDHWESRNIETRFTSVYHPQANPVETRMKIIGDCLRLLCPTQHRRWIQFISTIEQRMNDTFHRTTGHPPTTIFLQLKFTLDGKRIRMSEAEYRAVLKDAARTTKTQLEQRRSKNQRSHLTTFEPGDLVYTKNFTMSREASGVARKLNPLYVGPCQIVEARGTNAYLIRLPMGELVQHHVSNLRH